MDTSSQNGNLAYEPFSSPLKKLGNSVQIMVGSSGGVFGTDTTLRLNPLGSPTPFMPSQKGIKRKWSRISNSSGQLSGLPLCLRLGNSSSSSDSKGSSATACTSISSAKELDEESSMDLELDFSLNIGNEKVPSPNPKRSLDVHSKLTGAWLKVDLELSLSSGTAESDITTHGTNFIQSENTAKQNLTVGALHVDYGSAPLVGQPKHAFPSSSSVQNGLSCYLFNHGLPESTQVTTSKDLCSSVITSPKSMVTFSSGIGESHQQRNGSTKQCQFLGCVKGARGASGLCIAHGGGRRCQRAGCHKGAEGRTAFCKAHGGGRRCEFLGCTKSAEGRTDFCIAHGGGRRCCHDGCTRAARGKSGLCIRHGGGKRCQKENCTKSAEGLSGLCISHGGGRRCRYPECSKGAQGSTMFCKAHGGGKRCTFLGCTKGAEGSTPFCKGHGGGKRCSFQGGGVCPKSVHGGTLFCVAHGGGKRCVVPDCTKSARGRTDFCVRHGGGKRCKFDGCGKSAQGSTDFCKAHGGGKRCSWGHPGSEFGTRDLPCNSFSRGKTGLCSSHGALVQDKCVHGGATVGTLVQHPMPEEPEKMKDAIISDGMIFDNMKGEGSGLVTFTSCPGWKPSDPQPGDLPVTDINSTGRTISEGRVHGGSLMSILSGNSVHSLSSRDNMIGIRSEHQSSFPMHQNWM